MDTTNKQRKPSEGSWASKVFNASILAKEATEQAQRVDWQIMDSDNNTTDGDTPVPLTYTTQQPLQTLLIGHKSTHSEPIRESVQASHGPTINASPATHGNTGPESKLVKNKKRRKATITYGRYSPPYENFALLSTRETQRVEARDQKRTAKLQARTNAEFDKAEEESKYSKSAVDSVLIRKEEGNKGDKAEVQIKKILKSETEKESSPLLRTLFNLGPTDTVLFPTQSMKKAANKEKADCFMEVEQDQNNEIYKMSIKYVGSGNCSIVNQDHRAKKAYSPDWRNCEEGVLFHCLGGIDSLISRLNYERAIGDRSQDIPFINIDFTEVERKAMEALLVHHTFIGAGTGAFQPHVQSNCILIVGNVQDTNTWRLTPCFTDDDKKKYIQSKWDKYTLAIRGKGMQVEQSYRTDALPQHQLARWVSVWALPRFINRVEQKGYSYPVDGCEYVGNWWEKPKCTLNIRMKK